MEASDGFSRITNITNATPISAIHVIRYAQAVSFADPDTAEAFSTRHPLGTLSAIDWTEEVDTGDELWDAALVTPELGNAIRRGLLLESETKRTSVLER